jgi:hypothetical protein
MAFRWKGSLILLLMLMLFVICSFIYSNPYFYMPEAKSTGAIQGVLFYLFVSLGLTIIFSIGIYFTEKNILNKNYSNKWLFKFNVIFYIVVTIILEIASLVYPCSGESCMGKAIAIFWIPLVTLGVIIIFSVIPSYIFDRVYKK